MTKCYEKKAIPAIFFMFTLNMCGKEKINMLKDGLKRICISLGRNNDPVIAVLGIAVFKGVFRPLFTMMDKEEKPERKKYAAFREGLTEAIAFCSYLGTSFAAKKLAKPICKAVGKTTDSAIHKTEKSLSFIAVCLAAVAIIPGVCNLTLKPIMEAAQKLQKGKQTPENAPKQLDIKENSVDETIPKQAISPVLSDNAKNLLASIQKPAVTPAIGMKVGG